MTSVELFFSDESDSEREMQLRLRRVRREMRDHLNPLEMDTNKFILNFRLSKEAFLEVLRKIEDKIPEGCYQTKIPSILKLAVTLRFLAQGSYQLNVGNEGSFGLAQSSVSVVMKEVLNALEDTICEEYISFHCSEMEMEATKRAFFAKCGIPGIIGAIDGTHVRIVAPRKDLQHLYYNRKGYFSLNVLVVCDHEMRIRCIDATYPGSSHDAMVFRNSSLKAHLENEYENGARNMWLLGDAGYGLEPYLMTPYRNVETGSVESKFNVQHAKGRNIVERTIGVLKNRWRCTLGARALHYSPHKATQITSVCAALHNVCIKYKIPFNEDEMIPVVDAGTANTDNIDLDFQNEAAEHIRREIANFL